MKFNLTTNPWIPVRWKSGKGSSVSLKELFENASEISDLSLPTEERISVLRLLVCITQATLGAPETPYDWEGWGTDLENKVVAYLKKWEAHFELLGEGTRFLQNEFKDKRHYPIAQVVFHFSTGNNPTLLDHAGEQDRNLSPAYVARAILTYQNHFVGGSLGPKVKGNGPALKMLHTFLKGVNLRETILLNCLDLETLGEELGLPSWEEKSKRTDYLNRLAPTPCKLWLVQEGKRILIENGTKYQDFEDSDVVEPSATTIVRKEKKAILRASVDKAIWRDLHLITVMREKGFGAPKILQSHVGEGNTKEISFWCGEMIKAKDAKIHDAMESSFTVPYTLFSTIGQARYGNGVEFSAAQSRRLYGAVKKYYDTLRNGNPPTSMALRHFWNSLDQQSAILLRLIEGAGTEIDPMGTSPFGEEDPWTNVVLKTAREAYEATCPRKTPRQLEAYATGLSVLHRKFKKTTVSYPKKQNNNT